MLPNKNEGRVKIRAGSSSEGNSGNRRGSTRFHSTDRKISEELVNRLVSDLKETSLVWKTSSRYRRNKRASGRLWLQILNHLWVILTHKLITFSVFIGAFSSEAFKSWVEIQEIWNMWGKNRRIVFILGWDATVCAPIVDMKWRETDWNTLSDPVKTVCISCCVDFFGITRNHDVREASNTRNLRSVASPCSFHESILFWPPDSWTGRPAGETEPPAAYFNVQESLSSFSDSRPVSPMCWSAV